MDLDTIATIVSMLAGFVTLAAYLKHDTHREIAALESRLGLRLDGVESRLDDRIDRLDDRIDRLDDRMDRLDDRMDRLDDRIFSLAISLKPIIDRERTDSAP